MRDDKDPDARLVVLRRLLSLVTDPSATEAIRQSIAQLETMPRSPVETTPRPWPGARLAMMQRAGDESD